MGLDVGTTALKAAVFDRQTGQQISSVESRLTVDTAPDGTREIQTAQLNRCFDTALRRLRRLVGEDWQYVCGIGLASQGGSTAIVSRETGEMLTPMVLWNDQRAYSFLEKITQKKSRRFWRQVIGSDVPGMGLARICWFRKHVPKVVCDQNRLAGVGEYLFFRLTGCWRQDAGNAIQLGCYNVNTQNLDPRLAQLAGVSCSFFSPLRQGHQTCPIFKAAMKRYQLPEAVAVAGPYFDHEAGFLSAAGVSRSPLQCSLGTAWVGNALVAGTKRGFSPLQFELPSPIPRRPTHRMITQVMLAGNVTLDWGLKQLLDPHHKKALDKFPEIFKKTLLPPSGLIAFPWFTQPHCLADSQIGAGCFVGLNEHTQRDDLLRAIVCGMVFEFMRIFENIKKNKIVDSVVLGGGSGQSPVFQKLLASLFSPLPVWISQHPDQAGVRGVLYAFSKKIARMPVRVIKIPAPPKQAQIEQAFQQYKQAYEQFFPDRFGKPFDSETR